MIASIRCRLLLLALASLITRSVLAAPTNRGVTDTEILLGITGGFTGTSRELAQSTKTGIEIALAETNAAGGIYGRSLKLVGTDHANDPAKAVVLAKELVEKQKIFLLIGNTDSSSIERQLPYLLQQQVILFGAVSGGDLLHPLPPDRYVFNFRPSYADEVQLAVRHLIEVRHLKASEIAFFGQEDSFGDSCWKGFSKILRRYGADPNRAVHTGYRVNTMEVSQAVEAIRSNDWRLRAVVTCGTHKQVAALIGKIRDLKLTVTAVSAVESNALVEDLMQLGPRYAQGVIVTQVVPMPTSASSAVIRYREQLRKYATSAQPDYMSLQAYLTTLILVEGLRRTGQELTTDKLITAMESIHGWDLGLGATITFGPLQHDASTKVWGTVLMKDGSFAPLDLLPQ